MTDKPDFNLEELRREDEAMCAGYGLHAGTDTPALTPLLCVSRTRVWLAVTGVRSQIRIGVGVTGGARAGDRTGRPERF